MIPTHQQTQKPVSAGSPHQATRGSDQPVHPLLHLQSMVGNQAVQRLMQTKLTINQPGDEFEQEADRVAEQVMRMPESQVQRSCSCGGTCPECQTQHLAHEQERLQTKRVQTSNTVQKVAPPSVHEVLNSPGQPLDAATRAFMEPRFDHDFSRVRVHAGATAGQSAREVHAHAYTVGQHIVFATGQFAPATQPGQRLLAHELTHVVQQSSAGEATSGSTHGKRGSSDGMQQTTGLRVEGKKQIPARRLAVSTQSLQRDMVDDLAGETARELNTYVATHSSPYEHVREAIHNVPSGFEDNVAAAFIDLQSDSALEQFAANREGRNMLDVLYEAIITGNVSSFERKQAERIITARSQQIPPAQYIAQMKHEMIFPVRNVGFTREATATFRATLEPNGKVKVHYTSIRVYQFDMFKEDVKTLPGVQKTMDGFELDPDQIVGVKLYDEGGITVHVPALALIDFSNQIEQHTISKAATAFFTGLTLGAGGLGATSVEALAADVAAGQASRAALWAARGVLWADRIALALPVLSTVVNEHRGWIIEKFPQAGPGILDALDRANSIAAYYGWARLGIDGVRFINSALRPAEMAWHAERAALKDLSSSEEKLVKGIDDEIGIVLDDLSQAETEVSTATTSSVGQHPQANEGKVGQHDARVGADRIPTKTGADLVGTSRDVHLVGETETHALSIRRAGDRLHIQLCSKNCGDLIEKAEAMLARLPKRHPARWQLRKFINQARKAATWINELPPLEETKKALAELEQSLEKIQREHPDAVDPNISVISASPATTAEHMSVAEPTATSVEAPPTEIHEEEGSIPELVPKNTGSLQTRLGTTQGEMVGPFLIGGYKRLKGQAFVYDIFRIDNTLGRMIDTGPIRKLFNDLLQEAKAAGATELIVRCIAIMDDNVYSLLRIVPKMFGGVAHETGPLAIEVIVPVK